MGIPRFFGVVMRNYFPSTLIHRIPDGINALLLDLNSVLHNVSADYFNYGDSRKNRHPNENIRRDTYLRSKPYPELERELFDQIALKILDYVKEVKPSERLCLAVDGLAPLAKLNQQRGRRLRAAMARNEGRVNQTLTPGEALFDASGAFTPGTDVMRRLNTFLRGFIQKAQNLLPPTVVYCSHLTRGEGEHKLMAYIRDKIPVNESVVVVGADADLIMLGLHVDHPFYILRGEGHKTQQRNPRYQRPPQPDNIDVKAFRQQLTQAGVGLNEFTFAMFLFGNDFLPHQPGLDDISAAFPVMWQLLQGRKFTTGPGEIIFPEWLKFVQELVPLQQNLIQAAAKKVVDYPFILAQTALTPEGTLNYADFQGLWYKRMFNSPPVSYTPEQLGIAIANSTEKYYMTLLWVYDYYKKHQSVDWNFAYPRLYTPLISELTLIPPETKTPTASVYNLNPIGQLISVIPRASRGLVPEEAQIVYELGSPIFDLYPIQIGVLIEGKTQRESYLGIPLIAPLDINRVIAVQKRIQMSRARADLYNDEAVFVIERSRGGMVAPPPQVSIPRPNPEVRVVSEKPYNNHLFTNDDNMKILSDLYGWEVTRQIFPEHRRFYPDVKQMGGILMAFPVVPVVVQRRDQPRSNLT